MRSVFEMPIDELRDRADTVCEMCHELLEALPLLAHQPDGDASEDDLAESAAASEQALSMVRSCFQRIGELLPGLSSLRREDRDDAASATPRPEPRVVSEQQVSAIRRFLAANPAPVVRSDSAPTQRQQLLRRAHDAMARREVFERVGGAVGVLLEELQRLKLEVELRIGMPWTGRDGVGGN